MQMDIRFELKPKQRTKLEAEIAAAVVAHITDSMCAIVDHRPIGSTGMRAIFYCM